MILLTGRTSQGTLTLKFFYCRIFCFLHHELIILQKEGAELASVETLEDGKPASPDDGMESVKLDAEGDGEKDVEKAGLAGETPKRPVHLLWWDRLQRLSKHEKAIGKVENL